ncbi:MAG: hypothetical protein D6714_17470 [Bacteroidetes bacterium]|nr:MAG: hypothetical protein D6714_17470 [Bacteroidota bacterium]
MKTILTTFLLSISSFIFGQSFTWESVGIGGGGALFEPALNPHQPQELYAASDLGALYKTEDLGRNWSVVPFGQIATSSNSRMIFTDNPLIRYCITSNGFEFLPKKSTDGGQTWQYFAPPPLDVETWNLFADPDDANRLLATSYSELWFSNDGGQSFDVVYSAPDLYIGGVFWDGDQIYVGGRTGLLISTNGGAGFELSTLLGELPGNYGMLSMTGARTGDEVRLFCVARDSNTMWPGMLATEFWADQDIFRLDPTSGNGWVRTNTGIPVDDFPFFVAMARNDIQTIYTAGAKGWPNFPWVYKSEDSGETWQDVFLTENNANIATGWQGDGGDQNWWWGGNATGFTVAPENPDIAVITDLGFIHITENGGETWRQAYVHPSDQNPPGDTDNAHQKYHSIGLEQTSAWWVEKLQDDQIFIGYSDITGIRSDDGGTSWSFDYSGNDWNSTYHLVRGADGTLYAAVSDIHDLYQSTRLADSPVDEGNGAVLYSTDEAKTWQVLHDFGHPVVYLATDPANPGTLYASVVHSTEGGIFVTHDLNNGANSNWTRLPAPPRTEGHPFNILVLEDGRLLTTWSGRLDDDGSFTLSSGVFISDDGGQNWADRSHPDMQRWTKDLFVDPQNPDTWLVGVFSHWGAWPNEVGGVYRTFDAGQTWSLLGDFYRVESCRLIGERLFVCTETEGLWFSENPFDPAPQFRLIESFPFGHPTRVFPDQLSPDALSVYVTSFGTGTWRGNLIINSTTQTNSAPTLNLFPNPAKGQLWVDLPASGVPTRFEWYDLGGHLKKWTSLVSPGAPLKLDIATLRPGVYILLTQMGETVFRNKVVIED